MYTNRFATYWLNNGFTPLAVTTTPTLFTRWDHYQNGPGVDAVGSGRLVVKQPGYYIAKMNLSFNGDAGVVYFFQMRENGAANDFVSSVEGIASGGRVNVSLDAGGRPSAEDYIELYIWANGVANMTPVSGVFYVIST